MTPYWFYPEAEEVKDIFNRMQFKPRRGQIPTGLIDLNRSEDEIVASMSKHARRKLKKLETCPVHVYPVTELQDTKLLYKSLSMMRSERKILPMSWNEFRSTYQWTQENPEYGCCLRSDYEKVFISGMILLYGTKYAHGLAYAINLNIPEGIPNISQGLSLWWQSLLWAKNQGSQYYDVESYEENVDTSNPLYAVYQFKRQFNHHGLPASLLQKIARNIVASDEYRRGLSASDAARRVTAGSDARKGSINSSDGFH